MRSRRVLLPLAMILAALLLGAAPPQAVPRASGDAPVAQWIVGLEDGADLGAISDGLTITATFEHALHGFSALLTDALATSLASVPGVAFVERDRTFSTGAVPTGVDRIDGELVPAGGADTGRTVDVDVAVIDTGIDSAHTDLNVVQHVDCVSGGLLGGVFGGGGECTNGGTDGNGHGTHVAGTVGALDNGVGVVGVAPGARLWGVRVLNNLGTGTTSDIIKGVDWVTARADQVEVINMSLGGSGSSSAMNTAIANATNAGIVVVVAAGNESDNAANYTPANAPQAVTVSAFSDTDGQPGGNGGSCSGADDSFATYSNYGNVVELAAPGSCIVSTRAGGGTTSLSGTSMASPHVAGAAALWIDLNNVARSGNRKATVLSGLLGSWSVPQSSPCGFTNGISAEPALHLTACGDPPPTNQAPTVDITAPANGHTVAEGTSITFEAAASDAEDGGLSGAIAWSSSIDGALGSGASVTATLSPGTHTVVASVTDSAGVSGQDSISVTVTSDDPPPAEETATVGNIRWDHANGFLVFGGYVDAWVQVVDQDGAAISGASVSINLFRDGSLYATQTTTTASNGEAYFANDGVPNGGCWTITVTAVAAGAHEWDGQTPANQLCR